jgi:2-methylisocitrate lyase-like PEP mutase family enzyme
MAPRKRRGCGMADSRLRALAAERRALLVPGVYSALTARQAELAGFEAIYATGAGIANSLLAAPDLGLTTFKEVLDQIEYMTEAVQVPVIVDADTGFGNALNVQRVIRALERAGAAAAQLEDQEFPKRCGHFDGKRVIPTEEMLGKIRAAVDARVNPDFLIVGRTDARAGLGLEEAIERGERFAEAGADIIMVEAPLTLEEYAEVSQRIPVPCLANLVEGGKGEAPSQSQLREDILAYLRQHGSPAGAEDRFATWQERQALVRLDEYQELEQRYAEPPDDDAHAGA